MTATVDPQQVADRIGDIQATIDRLATRPCRLVAVTKRFGADAVAAALDAGVDDVGENYAQELAAKADALDRLRPDLAPRWHFIGGLQRNKVKLVARRIHVWETVSSMRLGAEVAKRAPGARVLVQVNLAGSSGQSGVEESEVAPLVEGLAGLDLDVAGLMMIGRAGDDDGTRALFARLRGLADDLDLAECSMGMTGDLEAALVEGSTIVRVGTAVFGPRPEADGPATR